MSDERNEHGGDEREQMRSMLGAAVAQAPEPPTVAEITARIEASADRRAESSQAGGGHDTEADYGGAEVDAVVDYVDVVDHRMTGRAARPRIVLAAAAAIPVVFAIGLAVFTGRNEPDRNTVAGPGGADERAAAMVPTGVPVGHVLSWIGSGMSDEGDRFAAVHFSATDTGSLKVQSVEVDPAEVDLVADARSSGSVELWDGREVVVEEDGRTVQFVDPAGVQVLVQGDPEVVRQVVPTLRVLDAKAWNEYVSDVGSAISDLPTLATFDLYPNELAEGELTMPGVTTSDVAVTVSLHSAPRVEVGGDSSTAGVVAGTCLTVDGVMACRPGDAALDIPGGVQSSFDVLIEGDWWHFGWSTNELAGVTVSPVDEPGLTVGVRWGYGANDGGDAMSWFASVQPADVDQIEVEVTDLGGGGSGAHQLRPAD